jgi:hypothetical protein
MKIRLLYIVMCFVGAMQAQVNLVPNGSFEDISHCPGSYEVINTAYGWFRPSEGSVDLFNECATFNGVPNNPFGSQYAQDGIGYCGGIQYTNDGPYQTRECLARKLNLQLKTNHYYCFKMYVSLAEHSSFIISSIGAYFSPDSIFSPTFEALPFEPQIENPTGNYISDSTNWKLIEGYFKADGDEQYIYIGNFRNNQNSDYMFPPLPPIQGVSHTYIYIDNVQLYECDSITGIKENPSNKINIYPNPASDIITINTGTLQDVEIELFDIAGRKLLQQKSIGINSSIDVSGLTTGIYVCQVSYNSRIIKREKVIITVR